MFYKLLEKPYRITILLCMNMDRIPFKLYLAPMAGITNLPYRLICRQYGADYTFTEMISSEGLIRKQRPTIDLLKTIPDEKNSLAVQIFGSDPYVMAEASKIIQDMGFLHIDINAGCPAKKVIRHGAGGALLGNMMLFKKIIENIRRVFNGILSIKIRLGLHKDRENFLEIGRLAEEEGVDLITLHPRYVSERFSGKADWRKMRLLKEALSIPVIGNGDITRKDEAILRFESSKVDGIMIGRATKGNPWIFSSIKYGDREISHLERKEVLLRHLSLVEEYTKNVSFGKKLGIAAWYIKDMPRAKQWRIGLKNIKNEQALYDAIKRYFDRLQEHIN